MISGMQFLYGGYHPGEHGIFHRHEKCRICGGPMDDAMQLAQTEISGSWTDEAIVAAKNSPYICTACSWLTSTMQLTKKKQGVRQLIWNTTYEDGKHYPVLIIKENEHIHLNYGDFVDFLSQNADSLFPSIIMIHGKSLHATQKHLQWKVNQAISMSPKRVHVGMSAMDLQGDAIATNGVATFDLDDFLQLFHKLEDAAKKYLVPYISFNPKEKNFSKALHLTDSLINCLEASSNISPTAFLAASLVGFRLFPSEPGK